MCVWFRRGCSVVLIKYTGKYVKIHFIMKITYHSETSVFIQFKYAPTLWTAIFVLNYAAKYEKSDGRIMIAQYSIE